MELNVNCKRVLVVVFKRESLLSSWLREEIGDFFRYTTMSNELSKQFMHFALKLLVMIFVNHRLMKCEAMIMIFMSFLIFMITI